MPQNPAWLAGGTIQPSRFVKESTTANATVLQAAANTDKPVGISQDGSLDPPGVVGSATDAARVGLPIQVYGHGEVCLLKAGTGGWTAGDELVSDGSGQGVTCPTTGTSNLYVGAVGLETVAAGELGLVQVRIYPLRPALS